MSWKTQKKQCLGKSYKKFYNSSKKEKFKSYGSYEKDIEVEKVKNVLKKKI